MLTPGPFGLGGSVASAEVFGRLFGFALRRLEIDRFRAASTSGRNFTPTLNAREYIAKLAR